MGLREHSKSSCWSQAASGHSLVKKLNISIDLVVYNTIIIDKIRVLNTTSRVKESKFPAEDRESDSSEFRGLGFFSIEAGKLATTLQSFVLEIFLLLVTSSMYIKLFM